MERVALVTGGSRGIGAATAERLAAAGWDIALSYLKRTETAEAVAERCRARGVRAAAVQADVADDAQVIDLFETVDRELGRLSALVNNAGVVALKSRVVDMGADRLRRMFAVNAVGPFLCAREAIRRMSTQHGGSGGVIVNVSSVAARLGSPDEYVDYAASKAAIDAMTIGLAKELARDGIRVNAVRPGIVETEIHASGGQPDRIERLKGLIPMQRAGQPAEIAGAIAWLCSEEASYVSGALLDIAGGR